MANCADCGKSLGFLERIDGVCTDCSAKRILAYRSEAGEAREREVAAAIEEEDTIASVLLTTEAVVNLPIVNRIEVVSAECAFGMNVFKDLFAGIRDIVGGRSAAVQNTMRDARRTVLYELKREAYLVGANAVVGVDLDYTEVGSGGTNMILVVATGTAVIIDENGQQ